MVHITQMIRTQKVFRTSFTLKNKTVLHWFPGHMGKGVKKMEQKLKTVDCIIEVHDARIPFSGRNPQSFQTVSGLRPHVLVYNKKDLADGNLEQQIINKHRENGFNNVVFTSCKNNDGHGISKLVPLAKKLILSSDRYNRNENLDFCLMVIGVPNVGKSSIINVLRNKYLCRGGGAPTGSKPGITKSVGEKIKISEDPLIYVLDTPGILTPKVPSVDVGMKLALCATIPDKEVGIELVADYLLFWLNKQGCFQYVDYFGSDEPSDSITELLTVFATRNNFTIKGKNAEGQYVLRPHLNYAASKFVDAFRKGLFGKLTLDVDILQSKLLKKEPYISWKQVRV